MTDLVPVVRTVADLRAQVQQWRLEGLKVGLVPTMGALHHGHLSLVHAIAEKCDKIVVSIFVNPTQFGKNEDLDKYPRDEKNDREKLASTPATLVFAPSAAEMYPAGYNTTVSVEGISSLLEGAERPGHFDGVATIVSKLLLQCLPDVAIFGEKDYQQLAVIRQMVADLNIPVEIMGGTLIRETDGLAASSRNAYLKADERKIAGQLNYILRGLAHSVLDGSDFRTAEQTATNKLISAGFTSVDYVTIADAETLEPVSDLSKPTRVLAVARIGGVRLLDNMPIEPHP